MMTNPLLNLQGLPAFTQIQHQHVLPAIEQVLTENRRHIAQLIEQAQPYTWDNFVQPLNELNDRLNRIWSPISHLHGVKDSPEWREAYNACLPLLSAYRSELGQNQGLYQAYQALAESSAYAQLNPAQQKVISNELRDFRLSGIHLEAAAQSRYREIQQRLSQLATQFSEQVLDATHAFKKHIVAEECLAGLPEL